MTNKYKLLLKDTIIFAIGSLGSKVILFFLVPLYTNFLTTAEYGTADLVSTFSTLLVPIVSLSIERAVIRYGMKQGADKSNVIVSAFFILICSVAVTFLIMPIVSLYRTVSEWWLYLAFQIILTNISEVEKAYLKIQNRNKLYSIIGISQTAVLALTNIILLTFMRTGVRGYLASNNIALLFCVIACFFAGRIYRDLRRPKIDWELLRQMIKYSAPLIFSGISWWILHSSDKVMIEWMIGASALGLYTAATKIPSLINVIIGIFNQAWGLSSIREIESSNDRSFYADIFNKFALILFAAGLLFISISKPFMSIYVGSAFKDSWQYTPFLLFAAVFYSIFSFMGSLYVALQRSVNDMWTSVMCAILNIIINYIGIKSFGAGGAVLGTAVSYILFAFIRIFDVKRYMIFDVKFRIYTVDCILLLIAALVETFTNVHVVVSAICILIFIIINRIELLDLLKQSKRLVKR